MRNFSQSWFLIRTEVRFQRGLAGLTGLANRLSFAVAVGIAIALVIIFFSCLFIWRACDGFEVASEYVGRNLSEGVRGGTINAVSSSMPELFTTLIALFVLSDMDGFALGIGTTAGSALFNGMIIPALCILSVVGSVVAGKRVDAVQVSFKVVMRDGLSLLTVSFILLVILLGTKLVWWQGLLLMILYVIYLCYMIGTMERSSSGSEDEEEASDPDENDDEDSEERGPIGTVFYWLSLGPLLDLEGRFIGEKQREQIRTETWNGWPLLVTATFVIGAACWLLVKGCEWLGTGAGNLAHPSFELFGTEFTGLGMPTMFVAVIFASMATSVPDTIISMRDARDGDYDDAVANALGSNVFDICFALGFPLFLYTIIHGSIEMRPETTEQGGELRFLLLLLTAVGFLVFLVGPRVKASSGGGRLIKLGRSNAFCLLALYGAFLAYVIGRSADAAWTVPIAEGINRLVNSLQVF